MNRFQILKDEELPFMEVKHSRGIPPSTPICLCLEGSKFGGVISELYLSDTGFTFNGTITFNLPVIPIFFLDKMELSIGKEIAFLIGNDIHKIFVQEARVEEKSDQSGWIVILKGIID